MRRAVAVVCVFVLSGAALNAWASEPTAEATESALESFGEQALTVGVPSLVLGPPAAAPHRWVHGLADRRIASPALDVPLRPPERL